MHPQLQRADTAIHRTVDGMSDTQMLLHPEGKWCTAEILEHLALTFAGTIKVMQRCLAEDKPLATKQSIQQIVGTFAVATFLYVPKGRKSPAQVMPKGADPKTAVAQIFGNLKRMDEAISACQAKFGASTKIADHPILGALTAKQWRGFHLAHTLHHMRQIERIKRTGVGEGIVAKA